MNSIINVKTGGKLYVAGEYSVLTPNQSAIIKNINIFMNAKINFLENFNEDLKNNKKNIEDIKKYKIFSDMFNYFVSLEYDKNYFLIQETIKVMNEFFESNEIEIKPFELEITGKMEKNGKKYGIGSSGSVTVLVIKAMFELYLKDILNSNLHKVINLKNIILDKNKLKNLIFKLSSYTLLKLGDNGSMGDIACISYENLILYKSFDRKKIQEKIKNESLEKVLEMNWGYEIEELECPENFEFLVGWTKNPSISKDMINIVKNSINEIFLENVENYVENLKKAIVTGDKENIKKYILLNGIELQNLNKEIYSDKLIKLVEMTKNLNICAKSSGSGGGDCGIAISFSKSDSQELIKRWEKVGIELLYKCNL